MVGPKLPKASHHTQREGAQGITSASMHATHMVHVAWYFTMEESPSAYAGYIDDPYLPENPP